ncbi:pyridoxal-phosphate dependent enzyme [Hoyosella rhizosphaerae]|uniref:Rhodanese domain-containing protein n=1 Tax=Hoyosella rhizosphaerae TaxID=1755582 RepID=A0A916X9S9_9ACTN|nr:pyridoxal-phosphate dependent enzyme [Hoyosella rhizosphaerae]MBN4926946.1 pyridoxal-phosphate dependent enzyme [Hoyosella rhizosphaerae]GGC55280.1 hypothetical protein GCM10011410_04570 [Hoyosella rhizosphaerae]
MRYESVTDAIGNTPLVRISSDVHGLQNIDLYAKMELLNPFGSVKDRAAWGMLREHVGDAQAEQQSIIELSSGNTAKALAILAGMHGLTFKSVTNRMKVPEVKDVLQLIGAEIEELPGQAECLDPTNTDDPLTRIHQEVSRDPAYLHTDQYYNSRNTRAHSDSTGPEIVADLDGTAPDHFIACIGTAGSSTGVAQVLRAARPDARVIGLVGQKSDFIPGIRNIDEVHEVGLFDPSTYNEIEAVSADEAIDGTLTLIRRCGILAGPTGGGAYFGAVRYLEKIDAQLASTGERHTAVFIVCDRVESYMSYFRSRRPDLFGDTVRRRVAATAEQIEQVSTLAPLNAQTWIKAEDPLIVDLRGSFAYSAAHIEGSINIPDQLFADLLQGGVPFPRQRPILLACPVGEQSAKYAAVLAGLGHPDARSLDGGIVAWRDAGAELVRD